MVKGHDGSAWLGRSPKISCSAMPSRRVSAAFRAPPALAPGARIRIVAPASPFDREELFRGLAWLRTRYELAIGGGVFGRAGDLRYLAGDDARRARELAHAFEEPDTAAIVCARGGYGVMRIVDRLPWDRLAERPKWIAGFSDITALHLEAQSRGMCSLHAPNVTGLGRRITASERASFLDALEGRRSTGWSDLRVLRAGGAEGPLVGGNLALVAAMAHRPLPAGAIVALEDVTERPYRVDRMLTTLRLAGTFAHAAAVVFGQFTQCEPGPEGTTIDQVLHDFAEHAIIPVLAGAPFGHGAPNHAFVLGARARIVGSALQME